MPLSFFHCDEDAPFDIERTELTGVHTAQIELILDGGGRISVEMTDAAGTVMDTIAMAGTDKAALEVGHPTCRVGRVTSVVVDR